MMIFVTYEQVGKFAACGSVDRSIQRKRVFREFTCHQKKNPDDFYTLNTTPLSKNFPVQHRKQRKARHHAIILQ